MTRWPTGRVTGIGIGRVPTHSSAAHFCVGERVRERRDKNTLEQTKTVTTHTYTVYD